MTAVVVEGCDIAVVATEAEWDSSAAVRGGCGVECILALEGKRDLGN